MTDTISERAMAILRANDRGGYTIPTSKLYPYQWNWDSAFTALGFHAFDRDRAWREIETLFEAQWDDGMVPHIVFRRNDPDYFPGPAVWQSRTTPETSGHSQPPVIASIVWRMVEQGDASDLARAGALFGKIFAYHRWFHTARDIEGEGLVKIIHPWESGRDNCPDWNSGMSRIVVPEDLEPYERRDTAHINPVQRPHKAQYDRYLTIIKFGRECGWDHAEIARGGPFLMADPGVQFILLRADRDLLRLAERLGESVAAETLRHWIARSEAGSQMLWNDDVGAFCAFDRRGEAFVDGVSSASMLAFFAGVGTPEQRERMAGHARRILDSVPFGLPSWDPAHSAFEAERYWCGPIWAIVNFMVAQGLAESGETGLSERLDTDTRRLIEAVGFYEYFDPLTGAGLGGSDFTWTAAIHIALSSGAPDARAA